MRPICFVSDFGLADDFVGTCKGVIATIAPEATIIDLTHEIPGFAIEVGAEVLQHATRYMPAHTVYLAVVDPGVGTSRHAVALRTGSGALMVGPDNGLLIPAAGALGGVASAVSLNNPEYHVHPVSSTFHGRDIFASAAAHLQTGVELSQLGEEVAPELLMDLSLPGLRKSTSGTQIAKIIDVDRYGNARLSIFEEEVGFGYGAALQVDAGDGDMPVRYLETFGAAKPGELVLVPDSHWRLSLAINKGSAAQALALEVGAEVRLTPEGSGDGET